MNNKRHELVVIIICHQVGCTQNTSVDKCTKMLIGDLLLCDHPSTAHYCNVL